MFEQITRKKIRFQSPKGALSIEDIWDLPLRDAILTLDDMAKNLSKALREKQESFVTLNKKDEALENLKLQFKVVKYIILVKLKEEEIVKERAKDKIKYKKIIDVIEEKEIDELKEKSSKALKKELKKYKENQ